MPEFPAELRARQTHLLAEMAYVDVKRRSEATLRFVPTTGLMASVFGDRDTWRDVKACDSSMFGHYLSCVPGNTGRDDLMLTGMTQDWADIGPDLRKFVEYQYVIPKRYVMKALTASEFILHMDRLYCEQHAIIMGAAHRADFSEAFATALILFVMEQWWFGINHAIGLGSLIEAQPGHTANDRMHSEQ
ncbi:hypothetical protein [Myxococcus stipitatus]|uniref:hypothetical protein n=1 Tax=Myxococcus stipitatus TaxID=83455 RepID=UPI0030D2D225